MCALVAFRCLGEHPAPPAGAGNLGALGFGWAIRVLAVFSARILRMASALLLPPERVEHYLANPASDTLAEPQIDLRQPLPSD